MTKEDHIARYKLLWLLGSLGLYPFHDFGDGIYRPISQHHPLFKEYKEKHAE